MADHYPLIVSSGVVQELASGDNLDLSDSGIVNAASIASTSITVGNVAITSVSANFPNQNTLLVIDSPDAVRHPLIRLGIGGTSGTGGLVGIGTTYNRSSATVEIYEDKGVATPGQGSFGADGSMGLWVINPNPLGYPYIGLGSEAQNGHYTYIGYRGIAGTAFDSGAYGPQSVQFAPHDVGGFDCISFKGDTKIYTGISSVNTSDSHRRVTIKHDNALNGTYVGIATTNPQKTLHLNGSFRFTSRGTPSTQTALHVNTSTGDVVETASSRRFKRDIEDYDKGLETLLQLRPVSFKFLEEERTNAGLIAEEVADLGLEEFVVREEDGTPRSIPYENLTALLINAIKELKAEVDALKAK